MQAVSFRFLVVALAIIFLTHNLLAQSNEAQIQFEKPTLDTKEKRKFAFERYFTKDKFGRTISFYISRSGPEPAAGKLPLVVCIQGSGSQSLFVEIDTKDGKLVASTGPEAAVYRKLKNRVRILVVEKPGVEFLLRPTRPGSSEEGSEDFNREFTLERWTEAIRASIVAARKLPFLDNSKLLVLGHSEGGQVACEVASKLDSVTHVACMAGGGPTQLFDFIQMAKSGTIYDPLKSRDERLKDLLSDWQKVLEDPEAHDKFILGHSHRRWTSFMNSSPAEAILKSNAKVFIAQGTEDTNSLPASATVLYAELLARGRDVTYLEVEGGDHAFMKPGDDDAGGLETNAKAVEWFLE